MLSVDRIEEGFAVAIDESGKRLHIPLEDICGNVREGDIVVFNGSSYYTDPAAAEERRKKILLLQNSLWE